MKPALLREPTKDASGTVCPAGSIIYGDRTEGWPGSRVSWAVANNRARYLEPKEVAELATLDEQPENVGPTEAPTDLDAGPASAGRRLVRRRGR